MNVPTATHHASGTGPPPGGRLRPTVRAGAVAGTVAGPFFLVASALQVPLYDEFDLTKHPFSFLSIGEHGWLQQLTFVVTGCLFILCAPAFVHGLSGRAGRWVEGWPHCSERERSSPASSSSTPPSASRRALLLGPPSTSARRRPHMVLDSLSRWSPGWCCCSWLVAD